MKMEYINVHGQKIEIADKEARDKIGNGELATFNKTLIGAINEIKNTPIKLDIGIDEANNMLVLTSDGGEQ